MADTDDLAADLPLPAGVTLPRGWRVGRRPAPIRLVFSTTDTHSHQKVLVLPDTSGTNISPASVQTQSDAPKWTARTTVGFDARETLAEGETYRVAVEAALDAMRSATHDNPLGEDAEATTAATGHAEQTDDGDATEAVCTRCGGTDDLQRTLAGDRLCGTCRDDAERRSDSRVAGQAGLDGF